MAIMKNRMIRAVWKRIAFLVCVVCLSHAIVAQNKTGDVILDAMRDELERNMSELSLEGYDKPFFMMYGLTDSKQYGVTATLGSLTSSVETGNRYKTTSRLLVGDYEFNDESLDENLISQPTPIEIDLPMDDDYYGIRRSFWSSTDKVYRDAARHFKKNAQALRETGKELKDIPHRSFAKAVPTQVITTGIPQSWDKKYWETTIRNLSAIFIKHPKILTSRVAVSFMQGHKYLVSSEGTLVKTPTAMVTFSAFAQSKNTDGEFIFDQVLYQKRKPDEIPSENDLSEAIEKMIARVEDLSMVPKFEEEYSGPVLLLGSTVADFTMRVFGRGNDSPVANDNIQKLTGFQFDQSASMSSKIGRMLIHESLSLKAKPKLTSYNGVELFGSYAIDNEGIIPADEVVLFDKGVLKTLMNNRTLTDPSQTSNGFANGPGVLELTCAVKYTEKELKDKLIAQAKLEGLDYAIILRNNNVSGFPSLNIYKVSLTDGKEELFRNAFLGQTSLKTLKRVLGASVSASAFNLGLMDFGRNFGPAATMTSLIVPEALLIEELDVRPMRSPSVKEDVYVSNPLEK
jgi:hypothetical protein